LTGLKLNFQHSLPAYFFVPDLVMTPQATQSPELPEKSVVLSSLLAWTTAALPSVSKTKSR
jgi:hypothetical protein